MLSAIVVLLVTGFVFYLSLAVFGVLGKAYEQYQERYVVKTVSDVSEMFLFIETRQLLVLNLASMLLLATFSYLFVNALAAVLMDSVAKRALTGKRLDEV